MERGTAQRALLVLLAALVAVQPISDRLARASYDRWGSPGSMYQQWRAYVLAPAPDVLFIGDSRVRFDIDPAAIANALEPSGSLRVSKIGVDALQPHVLAALVARVTSLPARPRLLVLELAEPQFNETWLTHPDSGGAETQYFWQMSEPLDPRYVPVALRYTQDPGRLLAGWAVPLLANYSVVAGGLRCQVEEFRGGRCDGGEHPELPMSADVAARSNGILSGYLAGYRIDPRQSRAAIDAIENARSHGIAVVVLILPAYRIEQIDAAGYAEFRRVVTAVTTEAAVSAIDLHRLYDDRPDLFTDPGHLTLDGARLFADRISRERLVRDAVVSVRPR